MDKKLKSWEKSIYKDLFFISEGLLDMKSSQLYRCNWKDDASGTICEIYRKCLMIHKLT